MSCSAIGLVHGNSQARRRVETRSKEFAVASMYASFHIALGQSRIVDSRAFAYHTTVAATEVGIGYSSVLAVPWTSLDYLPLSKRQ
jgi:hypothetical protein